MAELPKTLLSIIIPVYNEAISLKLLLTRIKHLEGALAGVKVEVIFVDDGSADSTFEILKSLHKEHNNIRVVKLATNAGSHPAIMAGLTYARGDCAIFLAGDLQDPPELIHDLLAQWRDGKKVVWGIREGVEGFKRPGFSKIYWWLCHNLVDSSIPPGGVDLFLIDRAAINQIIKRPHQWTPVFVAVSKTKYKAALVHYVKADRSEGKSGWTLAKKMLMVLDTLVISISAIRILAVIGVTLACIGLLTMPGALVAAVAHKVSIETAFVLLVLGVVLILGGVQTVIMTLLAETLQRDISELKQVPRYVVEEQLEPKKLETALMNKPYIQEVSPVVTQSAEPISGFLK